MKDSKLFPKNLSSKKLVQLVLIFGLLLLALTVISIPLFEEFKSEDYVKVNVLKIIGGNTVVVGNNCTAIIAQTSPERARSIKLGLKGLVNVRPNTHDVISDILEGFNITLKRALITHLSDGVYYSKMILENNEKILKLDSKPSDAIGVAIRTNSSIYINQTLLEVQGKNICVKGLGQ